MMKPNEELTYDIINQQTHVLIRNYWFFIYKNLRGRSVWSDVFLTHLEEYYPDPVDENSKRTGFPRTIWQRDSITWATYYEGLVILRRLYDIMNIELQLVYGNDAYILKYTIPVEWEIFNMGKNKGVDITSSGKRPDALVIPTDANREIEGRLSFIIREIMVKNKLTRKHLNALVDMFIKEPDNVCTFGSGKTENMRSSIITSMLKWNMRWDMFVRALRVLGFTSLSLCVEASKGDKIHAQSLTGMNLGI